MVFPHKGKSDTQGVDTAGIHIGRVQVLNLADTPAVEAPRFVQRMVMAQVGTDDQKITFEKPGKFFGLQIRNVPHNQRQQAALGTEMLDERQLYFQRMLRIVHKRMS